MSPKQYGIGEITLSLAQRGYKPNAAAGIGGNVWAESRGNSAAIGDSGTSAGYFQHHGPRAQALQRFAQANGQHWSDPGTQLAFLDHEISPALKAQLNASSSPEAAAQLFMSQYERPANQQVQGPQRQYYARQLSSLFQRLNPIGSAEAAEPGQKMSFDDAVGSFLADRNPGQPRPVMTPKTGGEAGSMTFDDAVGHFLANLPTPAAAPAQSTTENVTTPQGPQPVPQETAAMFAPVNRTAALSQAAGGMMNEYAAAEQGVTSTANQQTPIGVVAVDDGGRTIIDPGQGKPWQQFDPSKHVVFRAADGQPMAYPRGDQYEEGMLGRLGRMLRAGVVLGEGLFTAPAKTAAPVAQEAAPMVEEAPKAAHWSTTQARDAVGRWTAKPSNTSDMIGY